MDVWNYFFGDKYLVSMKYLDYKIPFYALLLLGSWFSGCI